MCKAKFSDWSAEIMKKQTSIPVKRVAAAASCLGLKSPTLCECLSDSLYLSVCLFPHFKMGDRKEIIS